MHAIERRAVFVANDLCAAAEHLLPADLAGAAALTCLFHVNTRTCGPLVTIANAAGRPAIAVVIREAGAEAQLATHDRTQNYARYANATGHAKILECRIWTPPPLEKLEMQKELAQKKTPPEPFVPLPDVAQGIMRIGVPLTVLGDLPLTIALRIRDAHIELFVDGVCVDEDFPMGLPGVALEVLHAEAGVIRARIWKEALSDDLLTELQGGSAKVQARANAILGPDVPLQQYWAPRGHNAWFGDTMVAADENELHLYWLLDRRWGSAKYGCGGHCFAHHVSADLKQWTQRSPAWPTTEIWEAANGTGCSVIHEGKHFLYSNVLTERLGKLSERHPQGVYLSTSDDGRVFHKEGFCGFTGEPGMVRDSKGLYQAVSSSRHPDGIWRTSRLVSADLRKWEMVDKDFLPSPGWPCTRDVYSCECFNWFAWRGWWFIIGGRTGFWRARELLGPYSRVHEGPDRPDWDIYDGLMVPQVAVFKDRAILAGWLVLDPNVYAGHLVFRELRMLPDGNLQMRHLPETEPEYGPARSLPDMAITATQTVAFTEMNLPQGSIRLTLRLDPREAKGRYGLRIGGTSESTTGVELRFSPEQKTVQWATPRPGQLAPDSVDMPFDGRDFQILNVSGLDRPVDLKVNIYHDRKGDSWILDAQINEMRTLITRRHVFRPGLASLFTEAGTLRASAFCRQLNPTA